MDTVKLRLVIQSHLINAMVEISNNPQRAQMRLLFVKSLIHKFHDTSIEISETELDEIWAEVN